MDLSPIIGPLNDTQREAVTLPPGPVLVLAGAGSGKTRVLTHRFCWLVRAGNISPFRILAVTFTNKAAREMRERMGQLLQDFPNNGLWIGTFHGLCHRLLRMHTKDVSLPDTFQIIDSDDQLRLIKRILAELNMDESRWPPKLLQWNINDLKDRGLRAHRVPPSSEYFEKKLVQVYTNYERTCQRLGLVDFAEILLRTLELLQNNAIVRETWQNRFEHILVDEFQDTNHIQYEWLRVLSHTTHNLFAVGDDDQSIYSWRGARVENMLGFETHFPHCKVIRLEQNYRSSGHILGAANGVIEHNTGRLGKALWSDAGQGDRVRLFTAPSGQYEAAFVIRAIQGWLHEGNRHDSIAILYRSNAQSRLFEEALLGHAIPYRVYGGMRFYERAEIKDALAYLRLVSNRHSDPAFERVVNVPPRGIGARTVEAIRNHAREHQQSMWQAAHEVVSRQQLPSRTSTAVGKFLALMDSIVSDSADGSLHQLTESVLQNTGLLDFYQNAQSERAEGRVENLRELITATRDFTPSETEDLELSPLDLFLTHTLLEAGESQLDEGENRVQLMTLHSAKGLEFPLVFICGLEEGLFPSQRSVTEGVLEEERRLFYVGMTRAMKQLYLCHATMRRLYGQEKLAMPSRFLSELPPEHVEKSPLWSFRHAGPPTQSAKTKSAFRPGDLVRHDKFGEGTVLALQGQGESLRVQIHFRQLDSHKWILPHYGKLEKISHEPATT